MHTLRRNAACLPEEASEKVPRYVGELLPSVGNCVLEPDLRGERLFASKGERLRATLQGGGDVKW